MRNIRLLIEYDGTDFSGWQCQPGQRTVQGCLHDAILQMTGEDVRPRGAGRTDAGVHAAGQVATFPLQAGIPETGLLRGLNSVLPADMAVLEVQQAPDDFDARFSARGKVYRYQVWNHLVRSPAHARTTWHCRGALDMDAIRQVAAILTGEHDFRGFRAADCDRKNTIRIVRRVDVERQGALVRFEIEATAFLRNMCRILVGTLVDVGRGRLTPEQVLRVLHTGDRTAGGVTAPPQGLSLVRVFY